MIKPSRVVFVSHALEQAFDALPNDDPIRKGIVRAVQDLRVNAFCGIQIPKRLFPKDYVREYGITNLWKYNLPRSWRLLYTVTAKNEVELISAILDWFDHKDYERKMSY
ncbi:MAG: hypothetical protein ABIH41_02720 [Nanoarchaeota archaeon]